MQLLEHINRIRALHYLILIEHTGTPKELATRFHLCVRQIYNVLDELRELGAEIRYDHERRTYYYKQPFKLEITINMSQKK